jgi:hypothetical protein
MRRRRNLIYLLLISIATLQFSIAPTTTLFEEVPSTYSGIHFNNKLEVYADPLKANGYVYRYNSSGVGIGDFNNDGLADIFFSGNNVANALYLNQGKFVFKDVSAAAGIKGNLTWGTGISIVDINDDGLLDIYVSHAGDYKDANKLKNELFINQGSVSGVPRFKESAADYGLALAGTHTTQTVFFDYDRDGDLDAFVMNHALEPYSVMHAAAVVHDKADALSSNMLLQNNKGRFTDVSKKAGIIGSVLNFGLGVIVSDINNDGWPDLYCTNDYSERDFLYLNQQNGTFRETGTRSFTHFSNFSMGADASDYNNDGLVDLVTLDMRPPDNYRQKISMMGDNEDDFSKNVNLGFHAQYTRNMLQMNTGIDQQGTPHFTEIGQMAGIAETDWSWSPLLADFDNDGWKDLFVSAGYADDMSLDRRNRFLQTKTDTAGIFKSNSFFYRNNGSNGFEDVTRKWKADKEAMSYAAVYADFNNDGKLDMVVSNLNDAPTVLKNQLSNDDKNYLSISLKQTGSNIFAIGAKVRVRTRAGEQLQELEPVRGYQSSQDYSLHFGLAKHTLADVTITWPDGSVTEQKAVSANQRLIIEKKNNLSPQTETATQKFSFVPRELPDKDSFVSRQYDHPDFKYQFSLPYKISDYGQVVADGDINKDGITDYYIGGEAGAQKFFMIGGADGGYRKHDPGCFDMADDNAAALLVDADNDGDLDLVLESRQGSVKQPQLYYSDTVFQFRLYENIGNEQFIERQGIMPELFPFKTIAAGDMDKDGDMDLFIGGYPPLAGFGKSTRSYILENRSIAGDISFKDVTRAVLPNSDLGMVTSAVWKDMNNDGYPELLVAGEWMSCRFFENRKGVLVDASLRSGLSTHTGLWTCIYPVDINGDGAMDLAVGNIGANNLFHISREHPAKLNMIDFENGRNNRHNPIPVVSAYYANGLEYLNLYRDELLSVSQRLRPVFNTYDAYAKPDLPAILQRTGAALDTILTCNTRESGVFINDGKNHFRFTAFPQFAQVSRVNSLTAFTKPNALPDLLLAGNYFGYRVQYGRQDALPVVHLKNTGGAFTALLPATTGLFVTGQVYKIYLQPLGNKKRVLLFKKNESPQLFEYDEQ